MKRSKIAIIGVGGRTGTMFAFELRDAADVLAIGREREVELIKKRKLFIKRRKKLSQVFEEEVIKDTEFRGRLEPDIIFLTTKNPISDPLRYYLKKCKKKIPTLLISQNGIAAISDAKKTLREVLGKKAEKVRMVRIVLFNPIDRIEPENKVYIKYSLPVRIAFAKISGEGDIEDIGEIFKRAGFEIKEFRSEDAKNLEFSKLFLNLIGMAAASRGVSVEYGFNNEEIFKEEVLALKEYIKVVKLAEGSFLDFPHYPVKFLSNLFDFLPLSFLLPLRAIIAKIISKGRGGKLKDLDEIDYYNGAVVSLGKKIGEKTPVNERIYKRALERLK